MPRTAARGLGSFEFFSGNARMVFQGTNRRHQNHDAGIQIAVGRDDIEILLRPQVKAKPGFGHHIIRQAQRQVCAMMLFVPWAMLAKGPP